MKQSIIGSIQNRLGYQVQLGIKYKYFSEDRFYPISMKIYTVRKKQIIIILPQKAINMLASLIFNFQNNS